jgi:ABC-2 type transport system ATP-binding protein
MEKAAIVVNNLTVKYGAFTAINSVSFAVQRGEIFGLLGPNGSGKTTLIKTLCGLITPTIGSGSILGLDIRNDAAEIKEHVGYMSQKFSLYEDLTVQENVDFYGGIYDLGGTYLRQCKEEIFGLTGLHRYLDRRAGLLSGGWKQRLALTCALIHKPAVVFLDEPTAGIDPVARRELWDLLFRFASQGVTFFVTTHYMDEAERCGRVGYIYLSNLIALGTPEELKLLPTVTPPGTMRLEIICRAASAALAFLKRLNYVVESTIFGQAIHVLVSGGNAISKLTTDLQNGGFGKAAIRQITPSLEDVFVTLTNKIQKESMPPTGQTAKLKS